jgi:cytochrome c oxidase assembly factor CtaG
LSAPSLPQLLVGPWSLDPTVIVPTAAGALAYLWGALRVRRGWPLRRSLAFLAGLAAILVALQSGIDAYDGQLLSVHMVQHLILLVVAPVLLLLGQPARLALLALPGRGRRRLGRSLSGLRPYVVPLACLALFYAVVFGTHVPAFYDATLTHPALHDGEHALYLGAALLLWWPVLGGDPAPSRRLNGFLQLAYVVAAMLPMETVGAYLSRAPSLFYPAYAGPARALGVSALNDQANAGAVMWVGSGFVMVLVVLWSAMAAMVEEERRQQARDRYAAPAERVGPIETGGLR